MAYESLCENLKCLLWCGVSPGALLHGCCTFSEHWHTVQQIQHVTRETPEIPLQRAPFTTACKLLFLLGSSNREKCFSRKYYPHFYYTFLTKTFCSALTPSRFPSPPFFFSHSVEVNKKQIKQEMRNENQVLLTIQQLRWKVLGFRCGIFLSSEGMKKPVSSHGHGWKRSVKSFRPRCFGQSHVDGLFISTEFLSRVRAAGSFTSGFSTAEGAGSLEHLPVSASLPCACCRTARA